MIQELWLKVEETLLIVFRAFQELPPLKRTILAVGLIVLIPGYFVTKYASYGFWNFRYADEYISARSSFTTTQELVVGQAKLLPLGPNIYTAYAEVENKNLDLSFNRASYEFAFYNRDRAQIASSRGFLFMLPNSKKFIIAPRVTSQDSIASVAVKVDNINWQKKAVIPAIILRSPEPTTYNSLNPLEFVAEGVVVNESPYRLSAVRIAFVLYNSSNEIIAVSERSEFAVLPNERRAYVQRWPNLYVEEVSKVEVFAETNALDGNNLILQDLPGASGTDLGRPEINLFY